MKFSIGVIYKKVLRKQEFHEDQVSNSLTLLKGINEFLHALSMLVDRRGCSSK